MSLHFLHGHAAHADARAAMAGAVAQVRASAAQIVGFEPTLGFLYFSDRYSGVAEALLADARAAWPRASIVGCVGVGVSASGVEYFDEPALALMLCNLPREHFALFNGRAPLQRDDAWAALVHADATTPELPELILELSHRLQSRYLFGGLAHGRSGTVTLADGVFTGGLSGVAFDSGVALVSRVTQGCQPIGRSHRVTRVERNLVLALDDEPALPMLLRELGVDLQQPQRAVQALRNTLVGLTDAGDSVLARGGQFGTDTRVRHLIGVDPAREAIAVADTVESGVQLAFCARNAQAARRDLVRVCTELREEVEADATAPVGAHAGEGEARRIAGAIYISCAGRGGPHFGAPSAELKIVQRALGDVPLVGFFASGEIARHHLYGYTGVLTAFIAEGR
jgi:small ligand-binding sensory domain FIST